MSISLEDAEEVVRDEEAPEECLWEETGDSVPQQNTNIVDDEEWDEMAKWWLPLHNVVPTALHFSV
jgi:hypothetical protein